MESTQTLSVNQPQTKETVAETCQRYFYTGSALLLLMLMFWGFHLFYLHGQAFPGHPLYPSVRTLLIAHGVAMTSWLVLFLVQPLLVVTNNRHIHMKVGLFGTGLAAAAVFFGVLSAPKAASLHPADFQLWGLDSMQFLAIPLSAMLCFATFVTIGIVKRKQREIHRPMMLLAALSAIPAALDRIPLTHRIFEGTILGNLFGPYASSLSIGLVLLGLNCALSRKLNRPLAIGYAALVVAAFMTMRVAPTHAWVSFATLLAH